MKLEIVRCRSKHKFPVFSWAVRFFQRANYSHFALVVDDRIVLDSSMRGVRFSWYNEYQKRYHIVGSDELRPVDLNQFINWSLPYLNTPYGKLQIIGLALIVMRLVKNNPFGKNAKRLVCNELVLLFLRDFYKIEVSDSDDYDLNATLEIIKGIKK